VRFALLRFDEPERTVAALNDLRRELREHGNKILAEENVPSSRRRFQFTCDMQFEGQFNVLETVVPFLADAPIRPRQLLAVAQIFIRHHERVYGYTLPDSVIEIQSIRLSAIGVTDDPPFRRISQGTRSAKAAIKGSRRAWFGGRATNTLVYESSLLKAGNEISGQAIVEAPTTTIKVDSQWNLKVDAIGSYLMWKKGTQLDHVLARLSSRGSGGASYRVGRRIA
jgi:N-methylhydantoinase A